MFRIFRNEEFSIKLTDRKVFVFSFIHGIRENIKCDIRMCRQKIPCRCIRSNCHSILAASHRIRNTVVVIRKNCFLHVSILIQVICFLQAFFKCRYLIPADLISIQPVPKIRFKFFNIIAPCGCRPHLECPYVFKRSVKRCDAVSLKRLTYIKKFVIRFRDLYPFFLKQSLVINNSHTACLDCKRKSVYFSVRSCKYVLVQKIIHKRLFREINTVFLYFKFILSRHFIIANKI